MKRNQILTLIICSTLGLAMGCDPVNESSSSSNREGDDDDDRQSTSKRSETRDPDDQNRSDTKQTSKSLPAPPDVESPPSGAEKTESGLASKVLEKGTGTVNPTKWDKVTVHYTGWTTDGKMFDSSVVDGEPISFPLNKVVPGWSEGVQLMVEGEKRRLWIPEELAYKGQRGAPQGMLVFDIELIKLDRVEVPEVPNDVSGPPSKAEKTESGLASVVLSKGDGTKRPTEDNVVKVHYSGWTTDGEMFDSSVMRKRPATFPLSGVIKGWTEGLQLMVEGEKRRFWIPEELAYKGRRGRPQGMLVFDVELLKIMR